MVKKHPEASVLPVRLPSDPVVAEVLEHFDTLYELLGMDEKIAKEIYDFLKIFPVHEHVRAIVRDVHVPMTSILPVDQPYRAGYSLDAILCCLVEEKRAESPDVAFLEHCVRTLMTFFAHLDTCTLSDKPTTIMKAQVARTTLGCISQGLQLCPSDGTSSFTNLPEASLFIDMIFETLALDPPIADLPERVANVQANLQINAFGVLFKAAEKKLLSWDDVSRGERLRNAITSLLLFEKRDSVRQGICESINDVANCEIASSIVDPAKEAESADNALNKIVVSIWFVVEDLLSQALAWPASSKEFFDVAHNLFRTYVASYPGRVDVSLLLRQWGQVLIEYTPHEYKFIGRHTADNVVLGFIRLIGTCLETAKADALLNDTSELLRALFKKYLFPDLSEESLTEAIEPTVPIMHEATREEIYRVLRLLCEDLSNFEIVLNDLLTDIIPYDVTYESNAYADRSKVIRASEGYAGLRNLSNTCYLNSLLTQLFMNVGFRKFMIDAPMQDDQETDQALLFETKKLFSYLQDTWQKSVDPSDFVESIRTYDNESIDVNIQMDVDEFYNLLFDRWESQIKSEELKKSFRSIYGGQLVQQIKSKECEHVSERLEPFSAIQCDIKGKTSLEESLSAYVEGEVMQGDNKYLCSSCERHVDAVKRACLKDVPDNLIFHLKRFDFDMLMMLRNKINDEFQFSSRIDITPYKAQYLNNPDEPVESDIFELVGVLVHSGTAESGHYYSYIRERPLASDSASGSASSWVEFNDSEVGRFNFADIPDQCWGGKRDFTNSAQNLRYDRAWNAYMLFYQRASSMEEEQKLYPRSANRPARVPLPLTINNHIAMQNEVFIRTYCLMAPYHSSFVLDLLRLSRALVEKDDKNECHVRLRRLAVFISMDHLEQLVARSKDQSHAGNYLAEMETAISESAENALVIFLWIGKRENGVCNLLLKSYGTLKVSFSRMILASLAKLQLESQNARNSTRQLSCFRDGLARGLEDVVAALDRIWSSIHLFSKAWDNYFGFLIDLASFSSQAARIILEHSFLQRCMELMIVGYDDAKRLRRQRLPYLRLVERGKHFPHVKVYELFLTLLLYIDFSLPSSSSLLSRESANGKFSLSDAEAALLDYRTTGTAEPMVFKKILEQRESRFVAHNIVEMFSDGSTAPGYEDGILRVLEEGLRLSPAQFSGPFLEATITFCGISPDEPRILHLVDYVINGMETISGTGGREHLAFFKALMETENPNIGKTMDWFTSLVLRRLSEWLPFLLCYPDNEIRKQTLKFAKEKLFDSIEDIDQGDGEPWLQKSCRDLCQVCLVKLREYTSVVTNTAVQCDETVLEILSQLIKLCLTTFYDQEDEDDAEYIHEALGNTIKPSCLLMFQERCANLDLSTELLAIVDRITVDASDEAISGK
ncbi:hypothetical protein KEM54_000931 [Ascosphaera aggregata]|nr:hypothetical protein KEM54_000931 [Ascosphaera aggregata]